MRYYPQIESVHDACQACRDAREELLASVDLQALPVEVITHLTKLNQIIGSLVELSTVELKKEHFRKNHG